MYCSAAPVAVENINFLRIQDVAEKSLSSHIDTVKGFILTLRLQIVENSVENVQNSCKTPNTVCYRKIK